jgi:hypothetical protein
MTNPLETIVNKIESSKLRPAYQWLIPTFGDYILFKAIKKEYLEKATKENKPINKIKVLIKYTKMVTFKYAAYSSFVNSIYTVCKGK